MLRHMQDVVPKAPKFFILYKRAGFRVIINHNGDMIVRPSAIEASVQVAGAPRVPVCPSGIAYHVMASCNGPLLAHHAYAIYHSSRGLPCMQATASRTT